MNTNTQHTPTPWTSGFGSTKAGSYADVYSVAKDVSKRTIVAAHVQADKSDLELQIANAAFIVRACNAHDELVAALRQCLTELEAYDEGSADPLDPHHVAIREARAALAKAGAA